MDHAFAFRRSLDAHEHEHANEKVEEDDRRLEGGRTGAPTRARPVLVPAPVLDLQTTEI